MPIRSINYKCIYIERRFNYYGGIILDKKIDKLLNYIQKNIPYYQNLSLKGFEDLPITNKSIIKDNYDLFLSTRIEDRKSILKALYNEFKISDYLVEKKISSNLVMEWTTGSSGIPFKCIKSSGERKQIALNLWKKRMEIDKRINPSNFYPMIHTGSKTNKYDIRDYSSHNIKNFYEYLAKNKIMCIHTTPNLLNRHINRSGLDEKFFRDKIPYIELTGNYLSTEDKNRFEKIFNAKILNLYGLIEVWGVAFSGKEDILYVLEDNVKLEILDDKMDPIRSCGEVGEIVITALNRFIFPFVRYRTGDKGYFVEGERGTGIKLSPSREINMLNLNGRRFDGTQLVKTVLRKIYWEKDFPDISAICLLHKKNNFIFVLNNIKNKSVFESIATKVLKKEIEIKDKVYFRYLSMEEYEKLNPKAYLFLEKN